jgi:UDP-2-acetamido-2,6-beta-L-arabino-hexul-4-ose reductase
MRLKTKMADHPKNVSIAITGANGFVGKNLMLRLAECGYSNLHALTRMNTEADWQSVISQADIVFHLAGSNRPTDTAEFKAINCGLTERLIDLVITSGRKPYIVYAGTVRSGEQTEYGESKSAAEAALARLASQGDAQVANWRLPNIFGKWAKPNYNSAVATFCHNLARSLPIQVNDPAAKLSLIYVDDLIDQWLDSLSTGAKRSGIVTPTGVYQTTVGELVEQLERFQCNRDVLLADAVGRGLTRALYATYVSSFPIEAFSYTIPSYADERGTFSEMLKTPNHGQFSYFTAHSGVTRGGHYHHSKTEKFLILQGTARFRFRHMVTDQTHEVVTSGQVPEVVETVPGWTHDVTNIGDGTLVAMLWANEIFDRDKPDTIACPLDIQ